LSGDSFSIFYRFISEDDTTAPVETLPEIEIAALRDQGMAPAY
jgi:hypothetical protein